MKQGQMYILYQDKKEVIRGTLKEISEALGKPYGTVAGWLRGFRSKDGYIIEALKEVKPKEIAKRSVRKMRTRTSSSLTKWN